MQGITVVFGTRPEAVKLLPLIRELRSAGISAVAVFTSQHEDMAECVFRDFGIYPDVRLKPPAKSLALAKRAAHLMRELACYFESTPSTPVIVQGDTLSAFSGAVSGHFSARRIFHVEAGLRSGDICAPYPEEFIRRAIADVAELHFAPNGIARNDLIKEGVLPEKIHVTGNTVQDAVRILSGSTVPSSYDVVFTLHRRESAHAREDILQALAHFAKNHPDIKILYPCHASPEIMRCAKAAISDIASITVTEPLPPSVLYPALRSATLVITDSGGICEECAILGTYALIMRDKTERLSEHSAGCFELVGTSGARIFARADELLRAPMPPKKMAKLTASPSKNITNIILSL